MDIERRFSSQGEGGFEKTEIIKTNKMDYIKEYTGNVLDITVGLSNTNQYIFIKPIIYDYLTLLMEGKRDNQPTIENLKDTYPYYQPGSGEEHKIYHSFSFPINSIYYKRCTDSVKRFLLNKYHAIADAEDINVHYQNPTIPVQLTPTGHFINSIDLFINDMNWQSLFTLQKIFEGTTDYQTNNFDEYNTKVGDKLTEFNTKYLSVKQQLSYNFNASPTTHEGWKEMVNKYFQFMYYCYNIYRETYEDFKFYITPDLTDVKEIKQNIFHYYNRTFFVRFAQLIYQTSQENELLTLCNHSMIAVNNAFHVLDIIKNIYTLTNTPPTPNVFNLQNAVVAQNTPAAIVPVANGNTYTNLLYGYFKLAIETQSDFDYLKQIVYGTPLYNNVVEAFEKFKEIIENNSNTHTSSKLTQTQQEAIEKKKNDFVDSTNTKYEENDFFTDNNEIGITDQELIILNTIIKEIKKSKVLDSTQTVVGGSNFFKTNLNSLDGFSVAGKGKCIKNNDFVSSNYRNHLYRGGTVTDLPAEYENLPKHLQRQRRLDYFDSFLNELTKNISFNGENEVKSRMEHIKHYYEKGLQRDGIQSIEDSTKNQLKILEEHKNFKDKLINDLRNKISNLQIELDKKQNTNTKTELEQLTKQKTELEKELTKLKDDITQKQKEFELIQDTKQEISKIKKIKSELEELKSENDKLKQQLLISSNSKQTSFLQNIFSSNNDVSSFDKLLKDNKEKRQILENNLKEYESLKQEYDDRIRKLTERIRIQNGISEEVKNSILSEVNSDSDEGLREENQGLRKESQGLINLIKSSNCNELDRPENEDINAYIGRLCDKIKENKQQIADIQAQHQTELVEINAKIAEISGYTFNCRDNGDVEIKNGDDQVVTIQGSTTLNNTNSKDDINANLDALVKKISQEYKKCCDSKLRIEKGKDTEIDHLKDYLKNIKDKLDQNTDPLKEPENSTIDTTQRICNDINKYVTKKIDSLKDILISILGDFNANCPIKDDINIDDGFEFKEILDNFFERINRGIKEICDTRDNTTQQNQVEHQRELDEINAKIAEISGYTFNCRDNAEVEIKNGNDVVSIQGSSTINTSNNSKDGIKANLDALVGIFSDKYKNCCQSNLEKKK